MATAQIEHALPRAIVDQEDARHHDERRLEDDKLRNNRRQLAIRRAYQERLRGFTLLFDAAGDDRDENIRIDDDALHVRCALYASARRQRPSPGHRDRPSWNLPIAKTPDVRL